MRRNTFPIVVVLLLAGLTGWLAIRPVARVAAILTPPSAPEWDTPPPGAQISEDTGAENPSIHLSPTDGMLMIVFDNWITGEEDKDPYYSLSTNKGDSWSSPLPIETSTGIDSLDVAMTFDQNGTAHAVWAERTQGPVIAATLLYGRYNGSSWSATPSILSSVSSFNPIIVSPDMAAAGNDAVEIVWSEGNPAGGTNPNIYFSRTTDNGNSWSSKTPVHVSLANSSLPAFVVAPNGIRHLAWTESRPAVPGQPTSEILYTQGIEAGGNISWANPITLTSGITTSHTQPDLLLVGDEVHLAYTRSFLKVTNDRLQWVAYRSCSNECMNSGNWSPELVVTGESEPVEVPESVPFDVISSMVQGVGCPHIFFHGATPETFNREVILGINGCDRWFQGGRAPVTDESMRGVNPFALSSGRDVYIVYENVSLDGQDTSQIYWMRGKFPSGLYLPIVLR